MSSGRAEGALNSPTEQQANAPVATTMDAKLMVATGSGDVQQLKDLVNKLEEDSKMMVVVMAKQQAAASVGKLHPPQGNMDPRLLAPASSGTPDESQTFVGGQASGHGGTDRGMTTRRASSHGDDAGANKLIQEEGATAQENSPVKQSNPPPLLVATTMDAKLMVATDSGDVQQLKDLVKEQESQMMVVVMANKQAAAAAAAAPAAAEKHHQGGSMDPRLLAWASSGLSEKLKALLNGGTDDTEANQSILEGVTAEGDTALHVVAAFGHGDGDNFLESARIIYGKAKHLLFAENNKGDTPLHCAARAGKFNMVACLIHLAFSEGDREDRVKELLRKQNKDKETALHGAVRVGNNHIVNLLMEKDSELATFPEDGRASPLYLAYVLRQDLICETIYNKSNGNLSFSGPHEQNALHAAVLRFGDTTNLLKWNKAHLCPQNKDLTTQRDENGSSPLHFAAAMEFKFWLSRICRQELFEANPDAGPIKSRIFHFWPLSICWQVLEANPDALYQPDHAGFFPIHVAASVGASWNVDMFVKKCPGSAGLRDAKGRTFLHVAVEKKELSVIRSACRNLSLSWIMNMVDNDGNTALHLAVEARSVRMFGALVANPQVNLNLPNNRGETPLDIAGYKIHGFYNTQSSEAQIRRTLRLVGAVKGVRRRDPLENNTTSRVIHDESEITEVLKDSTGTLCIGSVLIATVTFGATFAVPGGYIADDHSNGGSPILARRYAFDAFIASNTLAFVFSTMATISLMYCGSPLLNLWSRKMHLGAAVYLLWISITCLAAAFALGAFVVLAPVSLKTAVATCVLSSLAVLHKHVEVISRSLLLLPTLLKRKGLIWLFIYSARHFIAIMLFEYWPLILIFGWAAHTNPTPTLQAAPAQAPAALA